MVAFLEKHFDFTTNLPMDECVARLKALSKRGSGFFASRRDILVTFSNDAGRVSFKLDRDWGRNLYAEVHGHLTPNADATTQVVGLGKLRLFLLVFGVVYSTAALWIVYAFKEIPEFALLWAFAAVFPWVFLWITFKNRDSLIKLVKQTLDAYE